ncbi:WS/DGAT domain-containing protein [Williamsia sp. SKLECPSW1]
MHPTSSIRGRLTSTDAQALWMSGVIPSDQFLLYAFSGGMDAVGVLTERIIQRANTIADLRVRVVEVPAHLDSPRWTATTVAADAVRVHAVDEWTACLRRLGETMADQVDARHLPWRVHLFTGVRDVPSAAGTSVVAVLQISHALADGTLASTLARRLFDDAACATSEVRPPGPTVPPIAAAAVGVARIPLQAATLLARGTRAHRTHRDRVRDEESGRLPRRREGVARLSVNVAPDTRRDLRVVVTDADTLRDIGPTVTVGALTVIGRALAEHLGVSLLRAEVLIGGVGARRSRNHFRSVGVDLAVDEPDPARRASRIADDLAEMMRRGEHPAARAESAAIAAMPAALVAWGVRSFDVTAVPTTVSGNTVVSSVNRGDDDLVFGGGRVALTAGFPALSPVQSVTHGVHGIGGRVALSVCSSPTGLPDPDRYADRLAAALR